MSSIKLESKFSRIERYLKRNVDSLFTRIGFFTISNYKDISKFQISKSNNDREVRLWNKADEIGKIFTDRSKTHDIYVIPHIRFHKEIVEWISEGNASLNSKKLSDMLPESIMSIIEPYQTDNNGRQVTGNKIFIDNYAKGNYLLVYAVSKSWIKVVFIKIKLVLSIASGFVIGRLAWHGIKILFGLGA